MKKKEKDHLLNINSSKFDAHPERKRGRKMLRIAFFSLSTHTWNWNLRKLLLFCLLTHLYYGRLHTWIFFIAFSISNFISDYILLERTPSDSSHSLLTHSKSPDSGMDGLSAQVIHKFMFIHPYFFGAIDTRNITSFRNWENMFSILYKWLLIMFLVH